MKNTRAAAAVGLLAGLLFGAGLVVGGMTRPEKVRGFLDFTGNWDATLMFVMGGAVSVHALAYRLIRRRKRPVFQEAFQIPTRRDIDAKLVLGAAIFGLGWGFGGYCPGPAITSLTTGSASVFAFVAAMLGASWLTTRVEASLAHSKSKSKSNETVGGKPAREAALPTPDERFLKAQEIHHADCQARS